jgi:carbon monoxide dehydrogenase subunit G
MPADDQTIREAAQPTSPPQNARKKSTPMLLYSLLALGAIVLVFLGVVAMQPDDFRVTRSTKISAPPPAVFAQVNDFHNWEAWNPWGKIDPAMKQTYEGAPSGVASIYTWIGNAEVGEGRMSITDSHPSDLIRVKLEFMKPFAATHTAEFTFKPEGEQTAVTWSMAGKKNFVSKGIGLFMSMDKMIGDQFDKGLADMKSIVEAQPLQSKATISHQEEDAR